MRNAAFVLFTRLQGMDKQSADFNDLFGNYGRSKLRKMVETSIDDGKTCAMGFTLSVVEAILKAGPNDVPQETNHTRGAFHTSDWSCPTLTGDPDVKIKNHEVGAPGHALLPASLGLSASNPLQAPRSANGCQQPGCQGNSDDGPAEVRVCGHWGCEGCRTERCALCTTSLVAAMRYRGSWIRDNEWSVLPPPLLHTHARAHVIGPAVHVPEPLPR